MITCFSEATLKLIRLDLRKERELSTDKMRQYALSTICDAIVYTPYDTITPSMHELLFKVIGDVLKEQTVSKEYLKNIRATLEEASFEFFSKVS